MGDPLREAAERVVAWADHHQPWNPSGDFDALRAALAPKVTHGRHCPCSACEREDWGNPDLAHCGMHGAMCPPVYAPIAPSPAPGLPLVTELLGEVGFMRSCIASGEKLSPADLARQDKVMARAVEYARLAADAATDEARHAYPPRDGEAER